MSDDDKWVQLVTKMNALTQDKKLTWEGPTKHTLKNGRDATDYICKYKDKIFRIRKASGAVTTESGSGATVRRLRPTTYSLVIMEDDQVLYSFPDTAGMSDLYESVVYQRAGIQEIIDDLLKED